MKTEEKPKLIKKITSDVTTFHPCHGKRITAILAHISVKYPHIPLMALVLIANMTKFIESMYYKFPLIKFVLT